MPAEKRELGLLASLSFPGEVSHVSHIRRAIPYDHRPTKAVSTGEALVVLLYPYTPGKILLRTAYSTVQESAVVV